MVDKQVLFARLERLREYLDILESVLKYDLSRFVRDPFIHGTAERYLHLAIECLLDIGNHVISNRGYRKPENYADIFRILAEQEVIPASLYKELDGMAAFRNLLVHDYLRLDREKIYGIIHDKHKSMKELGDIFVGLV